MSLKKLQIKEYISYANTIFILLIIYSSRIYAVESSGLLSVELADTLDNTPLSNVKVLAFQRLPDNSLKWYQNKTSDSNGQINFDLPGLGNGTIYVLMTQQQNGSGWVTSSDIQNTGNYTFNVRNVRVKVFNGLNNQVLTRHKINAFKRDSNDKDTWFTSAESDTSGFADFYLPNLASGQRYIYKSLSPVDNTTWYTSEEIYQSGVSGFVIGNKPLTVSLVNGLDQYPLANIEVTAYQRLPDNSLKWFQNKFSDFNGQVNFNLQGLGEGTVYVLSIQQQRGSGWVRSDDIQNTGSYNFNVRNVRAKAVNGLNNQTLAEYEIHVYKRDLNNKDTWFASAKTDASGLADFYLPNLTSGQRYIFKSLSPVDNTTWYSSEEIYRSGVSTFVIGNKSLTVVLVNALDQTPLANVEVTAYQRLPDNSLKWFQKKTSDLNGRLGFDLQGLGSGSKYVLKTYPYGVEILSKDIAEPGGYTIQAGSVAATLRRKIDGSLLTGLKLHLLEKMASGKIEWRALSITNQNGMVRFDPEGLEQGKVYVIYGKNLLGNDLVYYSQWISSKGQFEFIVDLDDPQKRDEDSPVFKSFYPQDNAVLSDSGFIIRMKVVDNTTVNRVGVRIVDPVKGVSSGQAVLSNNEWIYSVTAGMVSSGQSIVVEAEAEDRVANKTKVIYTYSIIKDLEKPNISIISHREGDPIDEQGFLLTGTAVDNTGYVKLLASISDPVNGLVILDKELEIGKNNYWALVAKDLPRGQNVTVELKAVDTEGNETSSQLSLRVPTDMPSMTQLINRITFGATPELLKELREYGAVDFIEQQLQPKLIDDSVYEQQLNTLLGNDDVLSIKLKKIQISRAMFSRRQLLEVMTQFWESHFNTDFGKVNNSTLEAIENYLFHEYALGNFGDLLKISASSPAMLIFLDNKDSHKDEPNENYARELMELHTLGVDNGYTSQDIVEVARVFTGWSVRNNNFNFNKWIHDETEKTVLGITIPANSGIAGGVTVLELLARHDATAQHICTKLLQVFVSDTPSGRDVSDCADDFMLYSDEDNQIALVLEGIFKSAAFSDSLNFHNKVKTPLEFITGLARQLPVSISLDNTDKVLNEMGMPLFQYPLPTGWPEGADYWVSSGQLMQRWQIARDTVFDNPSEWQNYIVEPSNYFINQGIETTEGVLGDLFQLTLAHDYSELEWNEALSVLTNNNTEKFDIYASDADEKIRQLMALILQYPAYQLQ